MSDFHEPSYKTGVWVGRIIGAISQGCRSMCGTWPVDALPEDRESVETFAAIYGLTARFEGGDLYIEERQPPKLEVVK